MSDIRRHGFESDAQWREHLEEIEDMEARSAENRARRDLAALRDVTVHADAHVGQSLDVLVRVSARLGEIAVVDGEVHAEGQLLATGQFKIFMPEETA